MAEKEIKAWYDDIDAATLQRIKTYSAFNDYKSKNWMMQMLYEAIVTKYEKENAELKSENKYLKYELNVASAVIEKLQGE